MSIKELMHQDTASAQHFTGNAIYVIETIQIYTRLT